jgi:mannose-1-phosphate guanylyltransferase
MDQPGADVKRERLDGVRAVVLAGGDGSRLASLTRRLYGAAVPKPFAELAGNRSMLQRTLERIASLVEPARTLVVAPRAQAGRALVQLGLFPGVELLLQPGDHGTGPGILLPLARLHALEPQATVVFFPSDHHIPDPGPLLDVVRRAVDDVGSDAWQVALIGVEPDREEPELGWIVPGPPIAPGVCSVTSLVDRPLPPEARRLREADGMWNSFVMIGRVQALWDLARRHLPAQATRFESYMAADGRLDDARGLARLYERMPSASFGSDVLARADGLAVYRVRASGWCDWGTPAKVFESLAATPDHEDLLRRLERAPLSPAGDAS